MAIPQWQWKATMFISVFLSCVSFAIVMPSLWPYLDELGSTKQYLAWVVAMYSVGEAVGAIAFGSLGSKQSTRSVMVLATVWGGVGSVLYVAAPLSRSRGPSGVLVGRFLQGMWTGGAQAVQQSHLAKVLPAEELTETTVSLNAWACLGFVFGPFFGLVASYVPPFDLPVPFLSETSVLPFNEKTNAGYFVLLSTVLIVFLFSCYFGDDSEHGGAPADVVSDARSGERESLLSSNGPVVENADVGLSHTSSRLTLALFMCNLAFFIHFYGFAIQETITTPLVQAYFDWTVFQANLLFTAGGIASLAAFVAVAVLGKTVPDRVLVTWSLVIGAAGFSLLLSTPEKPLGVPRFLAGFLTISVAFPLGRATVVALYTKILPLPWQGTGQGIILAVGAVARIVGPFWAVRAFSFWLGGLIVFGVTVLCFLITLLLVGLTYGSLGSPKQDGDKQRYGTPAISA